MKPAMNWFVRMSSPLVLLVATFTISIGEETAPTTNGIPANAPAFEHLQVTPPSLLVIFKFTGGGLVSKSGENVEGFSVAGADRKFFPARAKIVGETVRLTSDGTKVPVAARYSWGTNGTATLFGRSGLPVAPFRTDSWPDPETK